MARKKHTSNFQSKRKTTRIKWQILTVSLDLILLNLSIILAFLIRFTGNLPKFNFGAYLDLALWITVIFAITYYVYELYDIERYFDWTGTLARILQANFLAIFLIIELSFILRVFAFPRSVYVISYFLISGSIAFFRYLISSLFNLELPKENILLISGEAKLASLSREIKEKEHLGLILKKIIQLEGEFTEETIKEIKEAVKKKDISRIIIDFNENTKDLVFRLSEEIPQFIRIQVVPDIYEALFARINFETLSDIPLIDIGAPPTGFWAKTGKRLFDIIFSAFFLTFLSPLFLLASVLIKATSEGPVFYRQKRVGCLGREFECLKFRTMVKDAEKLTGPVLASENDPRITRVGRFLRKYRIDELPQLINIFKGDMSLVGPRPERPEFVKEFSKKIPLYSYRLMVKPGATGLAQVFGRYDTLAQDKLKYDLIYIYNLSFYMDMFILFKTLSVVLTGKGSK